MPEKVVDCKYEKAFLHMTDLVKFSEKDVKDRWAAGGLIVCFQILGILYVNDCIMEPHGAGASAEGRVIYKICL